MRAQFQKSGNQISFFESTSSRVPGRQILYVGIKTLLRRDLQHAEMRAGQRQFIGVTVSFVHRLPRVLRLSQPCDDRAASFACGLGWTANRVFFHHSSSCFTQFSAKRITSSDRCRSGLPDTAVIQLSYKFTTNQAGGLTGFLDRRHREIIASLRPDPAVAGTD